MKEKSLVEVIPATILNENIKRFGFAPIAQHILTRLTFAGSQTITNNHYTDWSYDMMTNHTTNKNDTQMVVNEDLTASIYK